MAVLAAAALLDELMGRNRNIAPNDKGKELNWEDPEYCKLYLVKFCPHDLFVNTRADLGQCPKVHDDEVKSLYDKSNSYKKQQYEDEFIRFCQSMLNEVERKIVKGKQRLALIGKADAVRYLPLLHYRIIFGGMLPILLDLLKISISLSPAQTQRNEEQIKFLTEKINSLVDEAEQMGIQGNVEQAQGLMKLCDQLKEEREQLRGNNENSHWQQTAELAAAQEKQMEVCDVCGAFLIVGDAQQRIDDHLMGKQHVGYARLKMAMEELINNRQKSRDDKERKREEERRERTRLREEEERRRDRERDREREERRRKREEEERNRNRPKHRSRSPKSYHRRSGSRSRSRTRRSSRDKDFSKRSAKSCEERGKSSQNSRSKSRDRNRDYKRKDEHDRDHHRRSNKDRGELLKNHVLYATERRLQLHCMGTQNFDAIDYVLP
ncbi:hypothetical protein ANN_04657 [Periplaneta americana]|uniref:Luc7-like protein 3 n=1 Tax=Periplaneta americana TaxID=6978 RepID=A0ABQ8T8Z9_PERAM|nr:hypothetical protein ANN_04657 [Periplaneta americana]